MIFWWIIEFIVIFLDARIIACFFRDFIFLFIIIRVLLYLTRVLAIMLLLMMNVTVC